MLDRLRSPGGRLGTWSVVCGIGLAVIGVALTVAMLVRLVVGGTFWSDNDSDVVIGLVFGLVAVLGAGGLLMQDRTPWVGGLLAVAGGLAVALVLFWAVLPILLGLATVVVAALRARALAGGTSTA